MPILEEKIKRWVAASK